MSQPLYASRVDIIAKAMNIYSETYFIGNQDNTSFYLVVDKFERHYIEAICNTGYTTIGFVELEKSYPNIVNKAKRILLLK